MVADAVVGSRLAIDVGAVDEPDVEVGVAGSLTPGAVPVVDATGLLDPAGRVEATATLDGGPVVPLALLVTALPALALVVTAPPALAREPAVGACPVGSKKANAATTTEAITSSESTATRSATGRDRCRPDVCAAPGVSCVTPKG